MNLGTGSLTPMRNSQDGSFHYSGRGEVSLPQVDLEPTRRRPPTVASPTVAHVNARCSPAGGATHTLLHLHAVAYLHMQRADRCVNALPSSEGEIRGSTCNITVKKKKKRRKRTRWNHNALVVEAYIICISTSLG